MNGGTGGKFSRALSDITSLKSVSPASVHNPKGTKHVCAKEILPRRNAASETVSDAAGVTTAPTDPVTGETEVSVNSQMTSPRAELIIAKVSSPTDVTP